MPRRALLLLPALLLAACAGLEVGPQVPGRQGLARALDRIESAAAWGNWPLVLQSFYLPEHAEEVKRAFGGDASKWFRAGGELGTLAAGEAGRGPRICPLAFREKHFSPRFEPHYVVYYRIQMEPCAELLSGEAPPALAAGQMEWGFEIEARRWVHLRALGKDSAKP
ncbi:MAG: hypothetical protein HYZ11_10180 [Candidatus Tectomicrobia bacterium]|uniref:Lipoprotein n=1 Tax=Tectimicrobiota bacterium TaxID=2528274 RepID=A0A932MQC2_UNCTE|nr:hypothetical protein [Candidatus Tectomicrobia bacterium]